MHVTGGMGLISPPSLIDLGQCDADAVLALNNANQVETSLLDRASLDRLLRASGFAKAAAQAAGKAPDAFAIAFTEASGHDNDNLAWFRGRHDRFVYVDRVVVAEHARGRGLARALYGALFQQARLEGRNLVGCEINVVPPNPGSDALHAALGFEEIGRRNLPGGKVIRYMRLAL